MPNNTKSRNNPNNTADPKRQQTFSTQKSHKSITPFFDIKKKPSEKSLSILSRKRAQKRDDTRSSNKIPANREPKPPNQRTSIINIS